MSIAFVVATFNYALSWERFTASTPITLISAGNPPAKCVYAKDHTLTPECDVALAKMQEVEKEYVQNQTIKNTLLGITINNDDAPLLGSMAILIMSTWFFLCMKREQRIIFRLLTDAAKSGERSMFRPIYHGIVSYLVFTNIAPDDFPFRNLNGDQKLGEFLVIRIIYRIVLFLPALAILFIFLVSLYSLCVPSHIRPQSTILLFDLGWAEITEASIDLFISLASFVVAARICVVLAEFDQGTKKMLEEFSSLLPAYSSSTT